MATYKGIQGYSVQSLASDPSPTANHLGQLWYNSTSSTFKIAIEGAGAWASGTAAPTPGNQGAAAGIKTAFLIWGGSAPAPTANSFKYDGTTWTVANSLQNAISGTAGLGSQTAALGSGGYNLTDSPAYNNQSEEFNGTCWASANVDANKPSTGYLGLTGTQTAGLSVGGYGSPPGQINKVSEYDGTDWTTGNVFPASMSSIFCLGTQTAAVAVGGSPPVRVLGFDYDGTTWTAGDSINTARESGQAGGINTAGIIVGGAAPGKSNKTEKYDGSSWTEVAILGTARSSISNGYTNIAAATSAFIAATGDDGSKTTAVEEWTDPIIATKSVTVS